MSVGVIDAMAEADSASVRASPSDPAADSSPDPTTDPAWGLLERVASGDSASFDRLVLEHQDRLLGLCFRLLGDRGEAEDVTQEVFVKLYQKAGELKPVGRLYTWLYRVATNLCLNRLRRRKIVRFVPLLRPAGGDEGTVELDPPDLAADPQSELEAAERWLRTKRRIEELPEGQKVVLVLARFEGLSYREISRVLGITEGAVESRLFRAMSHLRRVAQES